MKERGILFSGPMVRAILDGRKSMTRRLIRPQPEFPCYYPGTDPDSFDPFFSCPEHFRKEGHQYSSYKVGMKLWVKETFHCDDPSVSQDIMSQRGGVYYRTTESHPEIFPKWTPSIFMPRWASRIDLEITDVKVERLQEISEADSHREGCVDIERFGESPFRSAKQGFRDLWNSINKKHPWALNPWVWVISFRRIKP
jgi:hypothetical protein